MNIIPITQQLEEVKARDVQIGDVLKCDDGKLRPISEIHAQLSYVFIVFTTDQRWFGLQTDYVKRVREHLKVYKDA